MKCTILSDSEYILSSTSSSSSLLSNMDAPTMLASSTGTTKLMRVGGSVAGASHHGTGIVCRGEEQTCSCIENCDIILNCKMSLEWGKMIHVYEFGIYFMHVGIMNVVARYTIRLRNAIKSHWNHLQNEIIGIARPPRAGTVVIDYFQNIQRVVKIVWFRNGLTLIRFLLSSLLILICVCSLPFFLVCIIPSCAQ